MRDPVEEVRRTRAQFERVAGWVKVLLWIQGVLWVLWILGKLAGGML